MPIPATSMINFEVVVFGTATTGGAGVTPSQNIFTFRRTGTSAPVNKASLNTQFQAVHMAAILAAMNVRYTPGNLTIRCLDDAQDAGTNFAVAGTGAIATDSLPSDAAVYVLLRTALRGRSFRGSKHFGPASEADTTNDILTGAGLANWQAVRDVMTTDLIDADGNTWKNTVYSRTLSSPHLLPVATIVANDVTESLLDLNIGTMRKRRSKTAR